MSIVTNLLGKLNYIGALESQVISLESRMNQMTVRRLHIRFGLRREWFSKTDSKRFDTSQNTRRAYLESQGRLPIAR